MDNRFPYAPEETQSPVPEDEPLQEDFSGFLPAEDIPISDAETLPEEFDSLLPAGDLEVQELPALFPEEEQLVAEPLPLFDDMEPTLVSRPKRKKSSVWRVILSVLTFIGKWLLAAALIVAVLAAGLIGYLTVTEYTPAYSEVAQRGAVNVTAAYPPEVEQSAEAGVAVEQPPMTLRLLSFNTGFAGLGEDADFFMDGGEMVNPESYSVVAENMAGIEALIREQDADVLLLQEVDTGSDRTFQQNQMLHYEYKLEDYEARFALNYSCDYVPYPLSERIGEVQSGIATYSRFNIESATRYSLPCPFSWPVRVANLKRCLLVTRIPIRGSAQELVIVNLHLEAYDDGEGKAAQTAQLLKLLQEEYEKGNYVIAGGDFNQAFPGTLDTYPILDRDYWTPGLLEDLPEGWKYAFDDGSPTCRLLNQPYDPSDRTTQHYVIDGFIVSPNVTIDRVETINAGFEFSDHNPVVLDITLDS